MSSRMRRLFDSQDMFSTVLRRLDQRIRNGRIEADGEKQLIALLHKIASGAFADRARRTDLDDRLLAAAARDRPVCGDGVARGDLPDTAALLAAVPDEADRELLILRSMGVEYDTIGVLQETRPEALRKRVERMVKRLGAQFTELGQ